MDDKQVFTVPEAAGWLRISRAKLYELIASGEIDCFRIGRCVRLSRRALEEFVERMEHEGVS